MGTGFPGLRGPVGSQGKEKPQRQERKSVSWPRAPALNLRPRRRRSGNRLRTGAGAAALMAPPRPPARPVIPRGAAPSSCRTRLRMAAGILTVSSVPPAGPGHQKSRLLRGPGQRVSPRLPASREQTLARANPTGESRAGAHSPRTSPGRPPAPQTLRKLSQGTARSTPRGEHGWGGLCVPYAADTEAGELDSHVRLGVGFSKALEQFCPVGEFCHFWGIGKVCGYALHATCFVGGRDPVKPGGPASWGHSPRPAPGDKHRTRAWRSPGGSHARGTHQGSTPRSGPSGGRVPESPKHTRGKRYTVAERPKDPRPCPSSTIVKPQHDASAVAQAHPREVPADAMSYGLPGGGQKGPSSPTRSVSRRGCWKSAPTKGQRVPEVPPGDPPPEEFQPGEAKYCLFTRLRCCLSQIC